MSETPRPWRASRTDMGSYHLDGSHFANIYAKDPEGRTHMGRPLPLVVAECRGPNLRANAALIVRAVNAHDDLLDALTRLWAWTTAMHQPSDRPAKMEKTVLEALKLAEGGSDGS